MRTAIPSRRPRARFAPALPGVPPRVARLRRRLWRHALWPGLLLGGAALAYLVVEHGVQLAVLLLGLGVLMLALHNPRRTALAAVAVTPVGTALVTEPAGLRLEMGDALWWLAGLATVAFLLFNRRRAVLSGPTLALIAFGAFLTANTLWAAERAVALREGIQFFTFVLPFFVLENVLHTRPDLRRSAALWIIGGLLLTLLTTVGRFGIPVSPYLKAGGGLSFMWMYEYFHPAKVATIAGTVSMICGALLLGRGRGGGVRAILAVVLFLTLALQLLLFKRVEIVGLALGSATLFVFYGWRRWSVFAVLGAIVGLSTMVLSPGMRDRFQELGNPEEGTSRWHYAYAAAGWEMFKDRPLLGGGAGVVEYRAAEIINTLNVFPFTVRHDERRAAHNLVVETAAESGLVGLAILGVFFLLILRKVFQARRIPGEAASTLRDLRAGLVAGSVLQLVVSMGQNPHNSTPFWVVLALMYLAFSIPEPAPAAVEPRPGGKLRPGAGGEPREAVWRPVPAGRGWRPVPAGRFGAPGRPATFLPRR